MNKLNTIDNEFRNFQMEVLAGDNDFLVTVVRPFFAARVLTSSVGVGLHLLVRLFARVLELQAPGGTHAAGRQLCIERRSGGCVRRGRTIRSPSGQEGMRSPRERSESCECEQSQGERADEQGKFVWDQRGADGVGWGLGAHRE